MPRNEQNPSELKSWETCTKCDLHKNARNHVLGRGDLPADILYIGEAPGPVEDMLGKPFVGPSGKLLDLLLDKSYACFNTDPKHYITNVVACFPAKDPDNSSKEGNFRPPTAEEAFKCFPRLEIVFDLAKPKLTVLLGKSALKHMKKPLQARGMPHVELQHPSFIMRNGGLPSYPAKKFIAHLRKAMVVHLDKN